MERYESRGYRVLAPSWPGLEGEVEALNADSTPLTQLNVDKIVDHYDGIIRGLDSPPIIMGHSLGGTIVQLLLAAASPPPASAWHPARVRGVPDLPFSTLRATRPSLLGKPFNRGNASPLNREAVPLRVREHAQPRGVGRDLRPLPRARGEPRSVRGRLRNADAQPVGDGRLRGRTARRMLAIAFEHDHIIPPKVARHNAEKYSKSPAITRVQGVRGPAALPGAPGWEEVADYALAWATEHAGPRAEPADRESTPTADGPRGHPRHAHRRTDRR